MTTPLDGTHMADQAALKRAFADFARTISDRYEIGDVLYRLTDHVREVLALHGAGVSLAAPDGALQFVSATDELTATVEQDQIRMRQGPCHDAYETGRRITASDLRSETRWPAYVDAAVGKGIRAAAGIPMMVGDERIGAVNLYVRGPREWLADDLSDAQLLADMATGYITNARVLEERTRLSEQLQRALDSRVIVEQAKGVLAGRHGMTTATAFDLVRGHARRTNTRLHEVARQVVEGELDLGRVDA